MKSFKYNNNTKHIKTYLNMLPSLKIVDIFLNLTHLIGLYTNKQINLAENRY